MYITAKQLRLLIETIWQAEAPKHYNLPPIDVEADDSREAGEKASLKYRDEHGAVGIDPFSIDIQKRVAKASIGSSAHNDFIHEFVGIMIHKGWQNENYIDRFVFDNPDLYDQLMKKGISDAIQLNKIPITQSSFDQYIRSLDVTKTISDDELIDWFGLYKDGLQHAVNRILTAP